MVPMTRKEIATQFLRLAASGKVNETYEKYMHKDFFHHNPYFPGDRESLRKGMEESAKEMPNKKYETLRVLEDGNLVAVHGRIRLKPDMPEIALMHILRFEGDKIIEEWEAAQEVPKDCPNENGVF
jgi:predicted SnoaL-like aldol condensation-catalyzing enzyme